MWDVTQEWGLHLVIMNISTHTSRVGCDGGLGEIAEGFQIFLLTHPVWDVTKEQGVRFRQLIISTHTSRVGCDEENGDEENSNSISTHTSRVGCDCTRIQVSFLDDDISTHTSRVGCDLNM